jgi:hypothetical protein
MKLLTGTSLAGYNGDNGPATSAQVRSIIPWSDTGGNLYIPDAENRRIRIINSAGIIRKFGGSGAQSTAGSSGPISSVSFNSPIPLSGMRLELLSTLVMSGMYGNTVFQRILFPSSHILRVWRRDLVGIMDRLALLSYLIRRVCG